MAFFNNLFRALGVVSGVALLLGGCGLFDGGDLKPGDPAPLIEFTPTLKVERIWRTSAGSGVGKAGLRIAPVYSGGRLFIADRSGRISIIDAETGRVAHRFSTELEISATLGVFENVILAGTLEGELFALDAESGAVNWRAPVSSEVLARPLLHDGVVIVRCVDGRVFGFDAADGTRLWLYDHSVPLLTLRGNGDPLARGGLVFIGYDGGEVIALRAQDGAVAWEQAVSNREGRTELDRLSDIDGSMAMVATDLYVSTVRGRLAALAVEQGRMLWVKDVGTALGVDVSRTRLTLSDTSDQVWLIDRRNAATLWKRDGLENRVLTRPSFYGDYVAVGDMQGFLHWLDAETGEFVARIKIGAPLFVPPLVVGTTLYQIDAAGNLSAFRAGAAI